MTPGYSADSDRSQLHIRWVRDLEDLEPRRAEWNALVDRSCTSTANQTFEWASSWWKAYGADGQCLVLIAERSGKMVGIAPLMLLRRPDLGRNRWVVQFIGSHVSDYLDFIVDPGHTDALRALCEFLLCLDIRWDVLLLTDIPGASETLALLPAVLRNRKGDVLVRHLWTAPILGLRDLTAARRAANLRSPRNNYNYYVRTGSLEMHTCSTVDDALSYLESFFAQHVARWEMTETPSQYRAPADRRFLQELARSLVSSRVFQLRALEFNGAPIAFSITLEYRQRALFYRQTYDVNLSQRSPGQVLMRLLLQDALDRDLEEFDFGTGDEDYKWYYSNDSRETYELRGYRRPGAYQLDLALLALRDWALPLVRHSPFLRPIGVWLMHRRPDLLD